MSIHADAVSKGIRCMSVDPPRKREFFKLRGNRIEILGRSIRLPANRLARMGMGIAFMIGGVFSFLPILGLWMLPLGLVILSVDMPFVRRFRRRSEVRWGRYRRPKFVAAATGEESKGWYRWVRLPSFGRR